MGVSFISRQQEEMLTYLMKENEELRQQNEVLIEKNQQLLMEAMEKNTDKICEKIISSFQSLQNNAVQALNHVDIKMREQNKKNEESFLSIKQELSGTTNAQTNRITVLLEGLSRQFMAQSNELQEQLDINKKFSSEKFNLVMEHISKYNKDTNRSISSLEERQAVAYQKMKNEEMEAIQKSNDNINHLRQTLENYRNLSETQLNDGIAMLQHDFSEGIGSLHQQFDDNKALMKKYSDKSTSDLLKSANALQTHLDKATSSVYKELEKHTAFLSNTSHKVNEQIQRIDLLHDSWVKLSVQFQDIYQQALKIVEEEEKLRKDTSHDLKIQIEELADLTKQYKEQYYSQEYVLRMEKLSQDSRQLLDIQRAINDLWEIMKVVWVDSLIDGYDKSGGM